MNLYRIVAVIVAVGALSACAGTAPSPSLTATPPFAAVQPTQALPASAVPTEAAAPTLPALPTAAPTLPATPALPAPPTSAAAPSLDRPLSLAEPRQNGTDVQALQQRLSELGYFVGTVDGIFGPQAEVAVRAFQTLNGLEADAIVGPQTWAALFDPTTEVAPTVAPIVDVTQGFMIGGSYGGVWLNSMMTAVVLSDDLTAYQLYKAEGLLSPASGTLQRGEPIAREPCSDLNLVEMQLPASTVAVDLSGRVIGVGATWNAAPRLPVELSANELRDLEEPIGALLRSNGIAEPEVIINRAVRVDLEGDGSAEIIIEARRNAVAKDRQNFSVAAGDYSLLVVMRGNDASMIPVVESYYLENVDFAAPNTSILLATLDLNNDGVLEMLVDSSYYEGTFTGIYGLAATQAELLAGAGCGV